MQNCDLVGVYIKVTLDKYNEYLIVTEPNIITRFSYGTIAVLSESSSSCIHGSPSFCKGKERELFL